MPIILLMISRRGSKLDNEKSSKMSGLISDRKTGTDTLRKKNDKQQTTLITSHYSDVIMSSMASKINGVSVAYSPIRIGADQRKHQSSASLAL